MRTSDRSANGSATARIVVPMRPEATAPTLADARSDPPR